MNILISEESGVRYLHFSPGWVQGAMRIARPWTLELEYTREMMAALLLHAEPDWPGSVLLVGLGAASLTKFLYRHRPGAKLTVAEIEPAVVAAARQYFRLPDESSRLNIEIVDAAEWVAKSKTRYDLILVDGYDERGRVGDLDSLPFYLNCKNRLGREGLLAVNLLSRRKGFAANVERLQLAFDGRAVAFPACESGNVIAFAAGGDPVVSSLAEMKQTAAQLRRETGLNLAPTLSRLEQAGICVGGSMRL